MGDGSRGAPEHSSPVGVGTRHGELALIRKKLQPGVVVKPTKTGCKRRLDGHFLRSRTVTWCILVIRRLIAFINLHIFELTFTKNYESRLAVLETTERGLSIRKHLVPFVLLVLFCGLMIYRLTVQSPEDSERTRARMHLELIYRLQSAHLKEVGTYLTIDSEKNGQILKLNEVPGRFRYRVTVEGSTFVAEARGGPERRRPA